MGDTFYGLVSQKLYKFPLHKKFTVMTDHKPLLYIFNKTKPINKIKFATLRNNFYIKYSYSEYMHLADLLSRCETLGEDEPDMDINMIWQSPMLEIKR